MDPIASAVKASDYTQILLAHLLGLTPQAMSDRMRGRTRWTLSDAQQLAPLLGVTLDELVGQGDDVEVDYELTEAGA